MNNYVNMKKLLNQTKVHSFSRRILQELSITLEVEGLDCDFLSGPATRQRQQEYVDALLREIVWESKHYAVYTVKTIFFGGGTPSVLEAEEITAILDCLRLQYQIDAPL